MNMPKIAIIGGGAVGTGFLRSIVDCISIAQTSVSGRIMIFDERARVGPGLPYGEDMATNLLNRPVSGMSLSKENPAEFYQWIRSNWSRFNRCGRALPSSEEFLPRSFFGRYLEDQWEHARQKGSALGLEIESVHSKVTDIILRNDTGYRLEWGNGTSINVDSVVLATGNRQGGKFAHLGERNAGFIESPYPTTALVNRIPGSARVGIIGTRLSAIDAVLALAHSGFKGQLTLMSRSGELPSVRAPQVLHRPSPEIRAFAHQCSVSKSPIPFSTIMERILAEIAIAERRPLSLEDITRPDLDGLQRFRQDYYHALEGMRPWQAVLVALNPIIPIFWNALSDKERILFHENHYSRFLTYRVGIPPVSARLILELIKEKRLRVVSGMRRIDMNESGASILAQDLTLDFDVIVDATGPWPDLSEKRNTLFRRMQDRDNIRPHKFGGLDVDFYTNQVKHADGRLHENMYAIGNLTVGVHLLTSLLKQNLIQIQTVSRRIAKSLFSDHMPVSNIDAAFSQVQDTDACKPFGKKPERQ